MKHIKSRSQEIEIPEDTPFVNDKLDRSHLCGVLTDVASFYGQSGCVMALNGKWGSGKTTFVKMWRQHLTNEGYKTLYFNAWSSDYTEDPLMALIAELSELSPGSDVLDKIVVGGARIILSVGKGLLKKITGVDSDMVEAALDEAEAMGKKYLDKYLEQKSTLEDFKKHVHQFVADNAVDHPIVFFIDELDRCNPHYAVSVLERVKHLFEIPNIIFVLAINKQELGHAIKGYYGSSNIDSEEYLRRFIDIEYNLPYPNLHKNFCFYARYNKNQVHMLSLKGKAVMASQPAAQSKV